MSVINQMLKDLDKRQAEQQGSNDFTLPVSSPSSNKKTIFISLLIIILLNAGGIFVWQIYVENQTLKMSTTPKINLIENQAAEVEYSAKLLSSSEPINISDNNDTGIVKSKNATVNNDFKEDELAQVDLNPAELSQNFSQDITIEAVASKVDEPAKLNIPLVNDSKSQQASLDSLPPVAKKSTLTISRKELTPNQLAEQKLKRAEQALANNDVSKAETMFEDVLLVLPTHKTARKHLAALWFGRQSYSAALNLLSQGINLSPNDSEFRVMQARIYLQQNSIQQAFDTLNNMPNVNEMLNVEYQSLRATTAQQLKKFSFSAQAYQILVNLEPSSGRWWLGLGVALDSNSEFKQASTAYQTALNKTGLSGSAENFARQRIIELGE
ncbi:tetratricopeptide repeat protein [Colwellia hornerae]|uniref:Tetratricopeptide repeat protein n=1 Tax=Colwellia hornerae TaxID=89402 RepID=A0A5C6Q704_9GAMM|nr:tetratricopeptide repeat protein [Colwellia hornerae]TWX49200.1 tetratricopeptide repeat protein [Colwellia hornerae]TWX55627.1 tetratricopeptide repeat protein [Colwellia hornerae]TWX64643.1 tetratricopeptide repeat protein [Colwellia hornerae]